MEERRTLYLLDGSAIDDKKPDVQSLTSVLYEAVKKPQIIDRDQIERNIDYLTQLRKFGETRYIFSISETITEKRAHIEVLNEQHNLIRQAITPKNKKKILRKQPKHLSKAYIRPILEEDELKDLREKLESLRLYGHLLTSFINQLENKSINLNRLNNSEHRMWRWAYEKASAIHPRSEKVKGHEKLGDLLETDVKIVSMAMALSLENQVVIMTRDGGLRKTLGKVKDAAGQNWRGKIRYPIISVREIEDVIYLEEQNNQKIRLPEDSQPELIR